MSRFKPQKIKESLEDSLGKSFIFLSTLFCLSPVLFVQKNNRSLRFCVEYQKLNAITILNRYLILLIEEILVRIISCKYLTKLDIITAINKLQIQSKSKDLTTFITFFGVFKYYMLPFGLIGGPALYQQYMKDTLFEYLNDFCLEYLDDIFIYSKTRKQHQEHIQKILLTFCKDGLLLDIEKCQFYFQETTFLGLIVSTKSLKIDP